MLPLILDWRYTTYSSGKFVIFANFEKDTFCDLYPGPVT